MTHWIRQAFASRPALLAMLVLVGHTVWLRSVLVEGYFTQHDFVLLARLNGEALSGALLTEPLAGELSPVGMLLAWAVERAAPLSWAGPTYAVLALHVLGALLLWLVLSRLLEERWLRLPLFVAAVLTPLTLGPIVWWSLALLHLPVQILFLAAVLALLLRVQEGWRHGPWIAGTAMTLLLLGNDRTLLLPWVVLLVLAGVLGGDQEGWRARVRAAWSASPALWGWMAVACVVRAFVSVREHGTALVSPEAWRSALDALLQSGLPAVAGGPWSGEVVETHLTAAGPAVLVGGLLLLLLLDALRRSGRPQGVVAGLGALLLLASGLVLSASSAGASASGRFLTDAAVVAVVLLAVALRGTPVPRALVRRSGPSPAFLAVAVAVAVLASAAITREALLPTLTGDDDRLYLANLAEGVASNPQAVLLDGPVPAGVMGPDLGEEARLSVVASALRDRPSFGSASEFLSLVTEQGYVWGIDVYAPVRSVRGPNRDCGYPVTAQRREIAMRRPVEDGAHVLRVDYFLDGDTYAVLDVAGERTTLPVRSGLHSLYVPVTRGYSSVSIALESREHTLCVTGLAAGVPVPAQLPSS
ncbi:hypothetical protein [Nocardioides campestrisoli]|uniref:hypothetical protein n=1 Tax=Nocardioides campestrisoli TaxID=2736757 RepID=UPI00163DE11F|nr:hypothetical protein [Nocardioides campestrisoli]